MVDELHGDDTREIYSRDSADLDIRRRCAASLNDEGSAYDKVAARRALARGR